MAGTCTGPQCINRESLRPLSRNIGVNWLVCFQTVEMNTGIPRCGLCLKSCGAGGDNDGGFKAAVCSAYCRDFGNKTECDKVNAGSGIGFGGGNQCPPESEFIKTLIFLEAPTNLVFPAVCCVIADPNVVGPSNVTGLGNCTLDNGECSQNISASKLELLGVDLSDFDICNYAKRGELGWRKDSDSSPTDIFLGTDRILGRYSNLHPIDVDKKPASA